MRKLSFKYARAERNAINIAARLSRDESAVGIQSEPILENETSDKERPEEQNIDTNASMMTSAAGEASSEQITEHGKIYQVADNSSQATIADQTWIEEHPEQKNFSNIQVSENLSCTLIGKATEEKYPLDSNSTQIYVKLLNGATMMVHVNLECTGTDLRNELQRRTGHRLDNCRFTTGKEIIFDARSLSSSGVGAYATVHVIARLVGGMDRPKRNKEVEKRDAEFNASKKAEAKALKESAKALKEATAAATAETKAAAKALKAARAAAAKVEESREKQATQDKRAADKKAVEDLATNYLAQQKAIAEANAEATAATQDKIAADKKAAAAEKKAVETNYLTEQEAKAEAKAAATIAKKAERKQASLAKRKKHDDDCRNPTSWIRQDGIANRPSVNDLPSQKETDQCVDDFITRVYGDTPEKRCV